MGVDNQIFMSWWEQMIWSPWWHQDIKIRLSTPIAHSHHPLTLPTWMNFQVDYSNRVYLQENILMFFTIITDDSNKTHTPKTNSGLDFGWFHLLCSNTQTQFQFLIIMAYCSGQYNYPTQFTNIAQCLWSILNGWYNYPTWFTKIAAEISKHPNPILVPNHCDPL